MEKSGERFVDVVFDLPVRQSFTYAVPESLRERAVPGVRVSAPFGKNQKMGVIVGPTESTSSRTVKSLVDVLDDRPITTPEVLKLCAWTAGYYYCSLGETVRAAVGGVWPVRPRSVIYASAERWEKTAAELRGLPKAARDILALLSEKGGVLLAKLADEVGPARARDALAVLERDGWVCRRTVAGKVPVPANALIVGTTPGREDELPREVIEFLTGRGAKPIPRHEFAKQLKVPDRRLASWLREGLLRWRPSVPSIDMNFSRDGLNAPLTEEQTQAVAVFDDLRRSGHPRPGLLFGVTGSGKTRVYIELARRAVQEGLRALILIPEIHLVRGAAAVWSAVFPGQVALWHSGMKPSDRYWVHQKIQDGEFDIVLGARSAVFAPVGDLGLIVVDEEHAETYKQSQPDPRYHARDAAVMRARLHGCLCVLGSATPSVESFANARQGKYRLMELKRRVPGRRLPIVHLVDLAGQRASVETGSDAVFTSIFMRTLRETIAKKQQAILFLNRRGHSTMVTCAECGWRMSCPHCGITLTFHLTDHTYRCHLCEFRCAAESICPHCGNHQFGFRGAGTQKVEEQLRALEPTWRIDRLDTDVAGTGSEAAQVLERFASGKTDVLVGTQMVAKGLDFPGVALVGVVWADRQLAFPDFRAEERTFQLVTQVAGRSGRGEHEGTVMVQTFHPDHRLIELAAAQDYVGFYEREITRRKELGYPPFARLVRLEFSSPDEETAYRAARTAARRLREELAQLPGRTAILGPAPAPIMKVRSRYRWRILLKTNSVTSLLKHLDSLLRELEQACRKAEGLRLVVDVDPVDFL